MWFRVSRVRAPYPTPLIGGSGITPGPPRLFHLGMSPSGKAQDFDSCIRAFEPRHPSQRGLASSARRFDSVAQQAEQLPFKQWVRGSNPRWVTKPPWTLCPRRFFRFYCCFSKESLVPGVGKSFYFCLLFCLLSMLPFPGLDGLDRITLWKSILRHIKK